MRRRRGIKERFDEKYVAVEPSGCWIWIGALQSRSRGRLGYGDIAVRGANGELRMVRAHRVSWEIHVGPIPDGMFVLHRCDVTLCVNPAHLFLGGHDENMSDMKKKGRSTHGQRNGRAKITKAEVQEIMSLRGSLSQTEIAHRFGLSRRQIGRIVNGERWEAQA